jgi:hypothetical protein
MPGNRFSRREPEVLFWEIAIDVPQARFRLADHAEVIRLCLVGKRDLAVTSVSRHASSADTVEGYRFVDRLAFGLCPVCWRIIVVGEYHDADQCDLFFLL